MKRMTKLVSVILSVAILSLTLLTVDVCAAVTGNLGVNETNVIWSLDEATGILTVSGNGRMKSLTSACGFSQKSGLVKTIIIDGEIENIGNNAFGVCYYATSISIPDTVTEIGENAFLNCEKLSTVYYSGTKAQWSEIDIKSGNGYLSDAIVNYKEEQHICSFGEWEIINYPTCVGEGSRIRKCECGAEEAEAISPTGVHNYQWQTVTEATCTLNGESKQICSVCKAVGDEKTINKTGHSPGEWINQTEATCGVNGLKVKICESCGKTVETQEIPKLEHDYGDWETVNEPTEYTAGLEVRACKNCTATEQRKTDKLQPSQKALIGDANDDGYVRATDARLVLQVVAGLENAEDICVDNADVNDDDTITAVDARLILQMVAGLI